MPGLRGEKTRGGIPLVAAASLSWQRHLYRGGGILCRRNRPGIGMSSHRPVAAASLPWRRHPMPPRLPRPPRHWDAGATGWENRRRHPVLWRRHPYRGGGILCRRAFPPAPASGCRGYGGGKPGIPMLPHPRHQDAPTDSARYTIRKVL